MLQFFRKLIYSKQFVSFILVGVVVNLINISIFHILTNYFELDHHLCVTLLFFFGTTLSYYLNAAFSFQANQYTAKDLARYFFVYSAALAIQNIIVYLGLLFSVPGTIAYIAAIGTTTMSNFLLLRFYVFKHT